MKLIVQIPCFNEASTVGDVLADIPKNIPGITSIETLIIDDGSTDGTVEAARKAGATHVVRHIKNLGLAATFRRGIDGCLERGADIIVNLDGDHQYKGSQIPRLIAPLLAGEADLTVGNRQTDTISEFSGLKKLLQKLGSLAVRRLSGTAAVDATSGFRAFTRRAALKLTILSHFTYTHETILQAQAKGLCLANVPIDTNPSVRKSRLMKSIGQYISFSVGWIIRVFTMYNPLKIFMTAGMILISLGLLLGARFTYYYLTVGDSGKIQSLILAAILLLSGFFTVLFGVVADLIQFNRRHLEDILERVKKLEYDK